MFEDLTRDEGWEPVKEAGYTGIASVAIDETWSAMRFRPAKEVGGSKRRSSPAKSETQFNKDETHNDTALTESCRNWNSILNAFPFSIRWHLFTNVPIRQCQA
ncbi:hypothetical protein GCM10009865_41090 [Aeromicrobium ponti]